MPTASTSNALSLVDRRYQDEDAETVQHVGR